MRRLIPAGLAVLALIAGVLLAQPAQATHGNWNPPSWGDVHETRSLSYAKYEAYWCFNTSGEMDVNPFVGTNKTNAFHYYRVYIKLRYPTLSVVDSGYKSLWADPGKAWAWYPPFGLVDRDREAYAIIKTSDGNTSYLDPFQLNSNEIQDVYPVATWYC